MFGLGKNDEGEERKLTEVEEAILAEAKPETEVEALVALGEVSDPKPVESKRCANCGQTMKPGVPCDCWKN